MKILKRLLITGANGKLGSICRTRLRHLADIIRVSSQNDLCKTNNNEEIFHCSLEDKDAVEKLVKGVDGIIHLGAHTEEANWQTIKKSNIDGMFNLYEGVRKTSAYPRIIFASSNHTTGFYKIQALEYMHFYHVCIRKLHYMSLSQAQYLNKYQIFY